MKDLIEALSIFAKYQNLDCPTHCEHDQLMVVGVYDELSEAETARLDELGFFFDEDLEYWYSFRFGSA